MVLLDSPRSRQDVDSIETLRSVHLGQHLIHDSIRHSRRIMSSTSSPAISTCSFSCEPGLTVEERWSQTRQRIGYKASQLEPSRTNLAPTEPRMSIQEPILRRDGTHALLTCSDVLVEDLRTLDRDEVETALFGDS